MGIIYFAAPAAPSIQQLGQLLLNIVTFLSYSTAAAVTSN